MRWKAALQVAEEVNTSGGFAGHSDWRLPNLIELSSIVDEACYKPAINSTRFPNTPPSYYWSATVSEDDSYYAWGVYFDYGSARDEYDDYDGHVRLVRGGQ